MPAPVADLAASRIPDRVHLTWTMPHRTTDRLVLKRPQLVHICRKVGSDPCATVADVTFPPEKPATFDDILPAGLASGTPRLLTYLAQIRNRHGRSAGDSNPAYAAAGSAPPPFADLHGQVTAEGVLLQWQPASFSADSNKVNIHRTLLSADAPPKPAEQKKTPMGSSSATPVKEQTLAVHLPSGRDTGRALDPDAAYDQRYSYTISRSATVTVGGKSVDMEGPTSPEIIVDTKDTFPPRAPSSLVAVADPEQGAIDLSWPPNTETDLAGYAVYRREGEGKSQRLSGNDPLETPSFHDQTAQSGHRYFYSVTAIDADGNESAPSSEAAETLPPKP